MKTSTDNAGKAGLSALVDRWIHMAFVILACGAVSLAGCSDDRPKVVKVSGQVLIDGVPLSRGTVRLVPKGARPSSGTLDENGRFTLSCFEKNDGAVPGTHQVAVYSQEVIDEDTVRWHAPPKYANHKTSGLTVEITEPTDSLVIELTWDGGKPFVQRD